MKNSTRFFAGLTLLAVPGLALYWWQKSHSEPKNTLPHPNTAQILAQGQVTFLPGAPAVEATQPKEDVSEGSIALNEPARPVGMPRRNPPPLASKAPSPHQKINEQPLWDMLSERRHEEVRSAIARIKKDHKDWQPPQKMLGLLAADELRPSIDKAIASKDSRALINIEKQHPEQFNCQNIHYLWALAESLHAQNQIAHAKKTYEWIMDNCQDEGHRLISLQKATQHLPPDVAQKMIEREASSQKSERPKAAFDEFQYGFYVYRFLSEFNDKRYTSALAYSEKIETKIRQLQATNAANLVAWAYFQNQNFSKAESWFAQSMLWKTSDDASYGLALSRLRQENPRGAEAVARQHATTSPRMRELLTDLLVTQADTAYKEGKFKESLNHFQEARKYRPLPRWARIIQAWDLYQLGDYSQAGTEFSALYHEQPDQDSAQGVVLSYSQSGNYSAIETLSREAPTPLNDVWKEFVAQDNYQRKLFLSAKHTVPDKFPQLANIDSPTIGLGIMGRYKSGGTGLSQLTIIKAPVSEVTYVYNDVNLWKFRLEKVMLDSGELAAGAQVGKYTPASGYMFPATTRLEDGIEPHLYYRRDGRFSPYIDLGTTPLSGVISSKPTWKLGFLKQERLGFWNAELFSQPVRESILSYTGITDPYSGEKWGRVVKTGLNLSGYHRIGTSFGIFGHGGFAELSGERVADNRSLSGGLSLTRNIQIKGFDYFAAGASVSYEDYQKNLSHFTLGQGGYFSPQRRVFLGGTVNFLTQENRNFILKGNAAMGYQTQQQDRSPFFPLAPNGDEFSASSQRGLGVTAQLHAVVRLEDYWQLGGELSLRQTPGYHDRSALIFLRLLYRPRKTVHSMDLPNYTSQTLY